MRGIVLVAWPHDFTSPCAVHFLITNDDGIAAEGLAALESAALALGGRVTVVAPATEQSMCGHRVTTHSPLVVRRLSDARYTVAGTPADCVRIALHGLGLRPDMVLSGINHGGNMGQDLVVSGTVAAVREAAYHGVRAAAFSHYIISGLAFDWQRAGQWVAELLRGLATQPTQDGEYWNVNLPHLPPGPLALPEQRLTQPARSPLPVAFSQTQAADGAEHFIYTARYADRGRDPGSDVEACFSGAVSVSRLSL